MVAASIGLTGYGLATGSDSAAQTGASLAGAGAALIAASGEEEKNDKLNQFEEEDYRKLKAENRVLKLENEFLKEQNFLEMEYIKKIASLETENRFLKGLPPSSSEKVSFEESKVIDNVEVDNEQ